MHHPPYHLLTVVFFVVFLARNICCSTGIQQKVAELYESGEKEEGRRLCDETFFSGSSFEHAVDDIDKFYCALLLFKTRPAEAIGMLRQLLSEREAGSEGNIASPSIEGMHFALAQLNREHGQWELAEQHFRRAIALVPTNAPFWRREFAEFINYYKISKMKGNSIQDTTVAKEEALMHYMEYLKDYPADAGILNDVGIILSDLGRREEAIEAYRRALLAAPKMYQARANMAMLLNHRGSTEDSQRVIDSLKQSIEDAKAHAVSGSVEAQIVLPKLLTNLGSVLDKSSLPGAIGAWEEAIALARERGGKNGHVPVEALDALANKRVDRNITEALALYSEARMEAERTGRPYVANAIHIKALTATPRIFVSSEEVQLWSWRHVNNLMSLLELAHRGKLAVDAFWRMTVSMSYYQVYLGVERYWVRGALADIFRTALPSLEWTSPLLATSRDATDLRTNAVKEGAPIKVGFYSEYLFEHSVSRLTRGVITGLSSRKDMDVVIFIPEWYTAGIALANPKDDLSFTLAPAIAAGARLVHVPDFVSAPDALRQRIAAEALDVLVYPEIGMSMSTYGLAFSKLARKSAMFWGHGVTSGIPAIDYFISSRHFHAMMPLGPPEASASWAAPEHVQKAYHETLYLMDSLTFAYNHPSLPPMGELYFDSSIAIGSIGERNIYVLPTTMFKLNPVNDIHLIDILRRDEKGIILAIHDPQTSYGEKVRRRLEQRFGALYASAMRRFQLIPSEKHEVYLKLLEYSTVTLLPMSVGSGNTLLETISVGTPFVSMPGSYLADLQRYGAGYLDVMGIDRACCVTNTAHEWVDAAIRLGTNATYRNIISAAFLSQKHRLFGKEQHAKAVHDWAKFLHHAATAP
eukprot:g4729.t1